jgi:hypothetical protein
MPRIPEPGIDEPRCVVNRREARGFAGSVLREAKLFIDAPNIRIPLHGTAGWRPEGIRSRVTGFRRLGGIVSSPTFPLHGKNGACALDCLMACKRVRSVCSARCGRRGSAGILLQRKIILDNCLTRTVLFWASRKLYTCSFWNELVCRPRQVFTMFKKLGLATALLALTLFSIAPAHAQESRASLGGRVTDPEGAVVPNAKVTVTPAETGVRQTTVALKFAYVML